jgi:hypothetical protein
MNHLATKLIKKKPESPKHQQVKNVSISATKVQKPRQLRVDKVVNQNSILKKDNKIKAVLKEVISDNNNVMKPVK